MWGRGAYRCRGRAGRAGASRPVGALGRERVAHGEGSGWRIGKGAAGALGREPLADGEGSGRRIGKGAAGAWVRERAAHGEESGLRKKMCNVQGARGFDTKHPHQGGRLQPIRPASCLTVPDFVAAFDTLGMAGSAALLTFFHNCVEASEAVGSVYAPLRVCEAQ
eukprot:347501-Chlamydomonas_euryale.AAC.1